MKRFTITVSDEVAAWIEKEVSETKRFRNVSHGFEFGVHQLMEKVREQA